MNLRVEVSNLGPLRSADQELAALTLIVGDNNSGKTFLATVCHRVLAASERLPWRRQIDAARPPESIGEWLVELSQRSDDQPISAIQIDSRILRWAESFATASLESFGWAVRSGLEYAYGVEANDLRRRTASRRATNCFLRVHSTDPTWSIQVRFDRPEIVVENLDVREWVANAFEPKSARRLFRRYVEEFGIREFADEDLTFISSGFYGTLQATLFDNFPQSTIHLPSGRTGVMHSYDVLASNIVQMSSEAGLRPIEIAPLHGTTADFLSLIIRPNRRGYRSRLPRELQQITSRLQREMRADIRFETDLGSRRRVVVDTPEGSFPLSNTSSMISELAPLVLVTKYSLNRGFHLTIDEPESHLHPKMQRLMAIYLVSLVNHGVAIAITTHSDYLVSEINNEIRLSRLVSPRSRTSASIGSGIDVSRVRATQMERKGNSCITTSIAVDPIDGIDLSTFTDVMAAQYADSAELVDKALDSDRTRVPPDDTRLL